MEIKNKQIGTRVEGKGDSGGMKGNMYKGPMGKDNGGALSSGMRVGWGRESNEGEMGTTINEQQ